MTRPYVQRSRAAATEETRGRILAVARDLIPGSSSLRVTEIAARAGVSVQTLYTHFGSKSGLLSATIADVSRDVGLETGFEGVWTSPDGETALRTMVRGTFTFWHRAWPYVEFTLRGRRADQMIGEQVVMLDESRHGHLIELCDALAATGRLRPGLDARQAADIAFALTTPTVYEELVPVRGWSLDRAVAVVSEAVLASIAGRADAEALGGRTGQSES